METEPEKPREKIAAPSRGVRLAWWFGIYGAALVPLVIRAFENEFNILVPIFFPLFLGFIFAPLLNLLPQFVGQVLILPLMFGGFLFYGWHLSATLKATTRRRFNFLLLVLVVVVLVNQFTASTAVGPMSN